jgi:hypothetical protein
MSTAAAELRLIGDFAPGQVITRWAGSSFAPCDEVRRAIELTWQRESTRPDVHLFDGPMCRLESFDLHPSSGRLTLVLSHTSYKPFLGTNLHNAHLADRLGRRALANPTGLSCGLLSRDGLLVMGRRNQRVAYYPGRVHPFAGALEPPGEDVFAEMSRELREELHLDPPDLLSMRCLGIVEDPALRQPELIFLAHAALSTPRIEAKLSPQEHDACVLLPLDPAGLERELSDPGRFTPVGLATLLLCGRARLGEAWFNAAATTLCIPTALP